MKKGITVVFFDLGQTLIELSGLPVAMSESLAAHLPQTQQNLKNHIYAWVLGTHALFLEHRNKEFLSLKDIHFFSLKTVLEKMALQVPDPLIRQIVEDAWRLFVDHSVFHPDVLPVLHILKHQGYKLGMITDSDTDVAQGMIQKHRLTEYFEVMMISGEIKRYKPDPFIFIEAVRRVGCSPDEAVYVGDSELDIHGAKKSGLVTVVVRRNELQDPAVNVQPDFYLSNLSGLPKLISQWTSRRVSVFFI